MVDHTCSVDPFRFISFACLSFYLPPRASFLTTSDLGEKNLYLRSPSAVCRSKDREEEETIEYKALFQNWKIAKSNPESCVLFCFVLACEPLILLFPPFSNPIIFIVSRCHTNILNKIPHRFPPSEPKDSGQTKEKNTSTIPLTHSPIANKKLLLLPIPLRRNHSARPSPPPYPAITSSAKKAKLLPPPPTSPAQIPRRSPAAAARCLHLERQSTNPLALARGRRRPSRRPRRPRMTGARLPTPRRGGASRTRLPSVSLVSRPLFYQN